MRAINNENLFAIIKKHPMLYDMNHEDYKSCQKKDKLWYQIARDYGENGEELKKRWKSLKDTYAKHLRRSQKDPKTRKWIWADHMKFFLPYLNYITRYSIVDTESDNGPDCEYEDATMDNDHHHQGSSINNDDNDLTVPKNEYVLSRSSYDDHDATEMEPSVHYAVEQTSPEPMPQPASTAMFTITNGVAAMKRPYNSGPTTNLVEENYAHKKPKLEYDDNESILLAYARTMKKFSAKRQAMTRFKIAQLIMEQELLHIEECEATRGRCGNTDN